MKNPENLQLRGGVWWFRKRVPADLLPVIGKPHFLASLRTSDKTQAIRLRNIKQADIQAIIDNARASPFSLPAIVERPEITEADARRLVQEWFKEADHHFSSLPIHQLPSELGLRRHTYFGKDVPKGERRARGLTHYLLKKHGYFYLYWFELAYDETGARVDRIDRKDPSATIGMMERYSEEAISEIELRVASRHNPIADARGDKHFATLTAKGRACEDLTISAVLRRFRSDKSKTAQSSKTMLKRNGQDRLIEEFFGSGTALSALSRNDARNFFEMLSLLPANSTKRFPGLSCREILALADDKRGTPMSSTTANSYMLALSGLMQYAVNEGFITHNVAKGLLFTNSAREKARVSLSANDLIKVFNSPIYRGCQDDKDHYNVPGNEKPRRARFWVPLILVFSGARANEICQLTCDDFVYEDGTALICIRHQPSRGKFVKTKNSERKIPIHPELLKIGLLAYVDKIRAQHGENAFIFSELPVGTTSYRSDPFSKWFAHFMDHAGITDRRKTLHSIRHSFRDALREAHLTVEIANALQGWMRTEMQAHYGEGLRPSKLFEGICRVSYKGLDLCFLYEDARGVSTL